MKTFSIALVVAALTGCATSAPERSVDDLLTKQEKRRTCIKPEELPACPRGQYMYVERRGFCVWKHGCVKKGV